MNKGFRMLLAGVLLSIVLGASWASYKVFFSHPSRSIPLLKGSSVVEAVQVLERLGLKARIDEEESKLPRGTVIGQWPETGGTLRTNKNVILKVSRGSEKVTLPDLRGLTQEQAVQRLQESGFPVGEIQKINHERPAGVVIAQNPAAPASISHGREVGLLVSLGPTAISGGVIVPDLVQRDEETAMTLAKESSFQPRVEYIFDLTSPQGMVVAQNPAAGKRTSRGTALVLRVASWDTALAPKKNAPEGRSAGGARVAVIQPAAGGTAPAPSRPASSGTAAPKTPPAAPNPQPAQNPPSAAQNPPASSPAAAPVTPHETPRPTPQAAPAPTTPAAQPAPGAQSATGGLPAIAARSKTAQIRYQVPPVKDQSLVIEMVDKNGERKLLDRKVNAGEYISLSVPYTGEAVVTIYLGGRFVWQDRYH